MFLSRKAICSELCFGKINLARMDKMGGLTDAGGDKPRSIAVVQVGGTEQKSETREHRASIASRLGGGSWTVDTQKKPGGDRRGKRTVNKRKGQHLVSDDWEFKTEPGIVSISRNCRVRKRSWSREGANRS